MVLSFSQPLFSEVLTHSFALSIAVFQHNLSLANQIVIPESEGFRSMSIWELSAQRHTTWTHLALHAADQLRQRVGWALSQIVAVGLAG